MVAGQEISANVLDAIGGGQGDVARGLIEAVGRNRRNIELDPDYPHNGRRIYGLDRLTVIGRKPVA